MHIAGKSSVFHEDRLRAYLRTNGTHVEAQKMHLPAEKHEYEQ